MKFQMKALSLAVLALAGFGMAGSAFAACPTVSSHTANSTPGGGGAWSSQSVGGGGFVDIVTPGLNGTSCAFAANIGATPVANVKGFVSDTSPANETSFRARWYFDVSALTLTLANFQTEMYNAFADTAPGTFNTDEIKVFLIGGGTPALRFKVADAGQASGFKTITQTLPTAITAGHYYVEVDFTQGAGSSSAVACNHGDAGCFRYWITAEGVAATDPGTAGTNAAFGTYSASNANWSGITQANLGLYSTSANFRTNNLSANLKVDEYDSRRQTFVGQ
jgi:hypothetical protein